MATGSHLAALWYWLNFVPKITQEKNIALILIIEAVANCIQVPDGLLI